MSSRPTDQPFERHLKIAVVGLGLGSTSRGTGGRLTCEGIPFVLYSVVGVEGYHLIWWYDDTPLGHKLVDLWDSH